MVDVVERRPRSTIASADIGGGAWVFAGRGRRGQGYLGDV
jgi:hypothetical protein